MDRRVVFFALAGLACFLMSLLTPDSLVSVARVIAVWYWVLAALFAVDHIARDRR